MSLLSDKKQQLRDSFADFNVAGYSAAPSGSGHILGDGYYRNADVARGIDGASSTTGLFRENSDVFFWWFGPDGAIRHENKTHLNNHGLVSRRDSSMARQSEKEYRIAVLGCEMTGATTSNVSWPDPLEDFLNQFADSQREFRVFNFGHLDTGIHEWKKIWLERAQAFDIDRLIVNIPDHTLVRLGEVYDDASHWDGVPGFRYVPYRLPDGREAVTWVVSPDDPPSLRRPNSYASKLITFWLDPDLAHDRHAVAMLRETVIDDYVEGANLETCADILHPRQHAYPAVPRHSADEQVAWVREHMRWFAENVENVLFTLNPWLPHFIDYNTYRSLDVLGGFDKRLDVVDMRHCWKLWGVHDDIATLYSPFAPEKWSDEGHRLYGEAVGLTVLDRLGIEFP